MARSAEALRRRALKRQRTEEEQRKADWKDVLKQQEEKNNKKKRRLKVGEEDIESNRKMEDQKKEDIGKETKQLQQKQREPKQHVQDSNAKKERFNSGTHNVEKSPAENSLPNVSESNNDSPKEHETKIVRNEEKDHRNAKPSQQHRYETGKDGGYKSRREKSQQCPQNQKKGPNSTSDTYQKSFHNQQQKQDHVTESKKKKQQQHDQQTQTKKHSWKPQASEDIVSRNNDLRERYIQYLASQEKKKNGTEGDGDDNDLDQDVSSVVSMSPADIERAKVLIERSRRKQEKKLRMKEERQKRLQEKEEKKKAKMAQSSSTPNNDKKTNDQSPSFSSPSSSKKNSSEINHKAVREQNRRLRKLYQDTGGKGMELGQIERAKMLLARDERKKLDRVGKEKKQRTKK